MQLTKIYPFLDSLTTRERKVLAHAADGFTNPQMATLFISAESTIKKHREHIYRKADVTGNLEIRRFLREIRPYLI